MQREGIGAGDGRGLTQSEELAWKVWEQEDEEELNGGFKGRVEMFKAGFKRFQQEQEQEEERQGVLVFYQLNFSTVTGDNRRLTGSKWRHVNDSVRP